MKDSHQDLFSLIAQYEHEVTEAVGMPLSMIRFAASFLASVVIGLLLKFIPTVKGEVGGTYVSTIIRAIVSRCNIQHAAFPVYHSLARDNYLTSAVGHRRSTPGLGAVLNNIWNVSDLWTMPQELNDCGLVVGRHIYATVTGFGLLYYPFGNGVFHLFVPTVLTYFVMLQFQDTSATLSWLVNFTYLIGW